MSTDNLGRFQPHVTYHQSHIQKYMIIHLYKHNSGNTHYRYTYLYTYIYIYIYIHMYTIYDGKYIYINNICISYPTSPASTNLGTPCGMAEWRRPATGELGAVEAPPGPRPTNPPVPSFLGKMGEISEISMGFSY